MARKTGTSVEKIKDFTSLADHDASTLKEGHVTLLKFDTYTIRRIIHNGEPFYSVVDAVGALVETQAKDAGAYWRKLKQRLLEQGADKVVTDCHELKLPAADGKATGPTAPTSRRCSESSSPSHPRRRSPSSSGWRRSASSAFARRPSRRASPGAWSRPIATIVKS
jgi:hypothetical protein